MSSIIEQLKLRGDLNIKVLDAEGKIKDERDEKNLVVTAGLTYICSRMAGTAKSVIDRKSVV